MLPKTIVYTCVTCRRDRLPYQTSLTPNIDFACFTDEPEALQNYGWDIRPLRVVQDCGRLTARWHKLNPHTHSPDYDFWFWVDGHINLRVAAAKLIGEMVDNDRDLAIFRHRIFADPYEELEIFEQRPQHFQITLEAVQMARDRLRQDDYPRGGGTHETAILVMRRCPSIIQFLTDWWEHIVEFGVPRDQIHVSRLLRKSNVRVYEPIGNVANNEYTIWHHHDHPSSDETEKMQKQWMTTKS